MEEKQLCRPFGFYLANVGDYFWLKTVDFGRNVLSVKLIVVTSLVPGNNTQPNLVLTSAKQFITLLKKNAINFFLKMWSSVMSTLIRYKLGYNAIFVRWLHFIEAVCVTLKKYIHAWL